MKTSPAFQFYPADFLIGTLHMTAEQIGAYVILLCYQWEQGHVPDDDAKLQSLSKCQANALPIVLEKFPVCEDGFRRNARLESYRDEIEAKRSKNAESGRKGGKARSGSSKGSKASPKRSSSERLAPAKQTPSTHTYTHTYINTPLPPEGEQRCAEELPFENREDLPPWSGNLGMVMSHLQQMLLNTGDFTTEELRAYALQRIADEWTVGENRKRVKPCAADFLRFQASYRANRARSGRQGAGSQQPVSPATEPGQPDPAEDVRQKHFLRTWWPENRHLDPDGNDYFPDNFREINDTGALNAARKAYWQWLKNSQTNAS